MTSQKVYAYNELTGVVAAVPAHYLTHPTLGANLRPVRNGKTRGRLSEVIDSKDEPEFQITFVNTEATPKPDETKED